LEHVLDHLRTSECPPAQRDEHAPMPLEELRERGSIARLGGPYECGVAEIVRDGRVHHLS
jgi:hypothetical protein